MSSTATSKYYSPLPLLTSLTSYTYASLPAVLTTRTERYLEDRTLAFVGSQVKVGRLRVVGLDGRVRVFGPAIGSGWVAGDGVAASRGMGLDTELPLTPPYSKASSSRTSTNPPGTPTTTALDLPSTDPSTTTPASPEDSPSISITILSPKFYLRLLTAGDLGFAESYMAGEFSLSYDGLGIEDGEGTGQSGVQGQRLDEAYYGTEIAGVKGESGVREGEGLLDLFKIIIRSDHPASSSSFSSSPSSSSKAVGLSTIPSQLLSLFGSYFRDSRVVNSVRNSVGNIRAHYDISNRMFGSFLSREMTYSSAIFPFLDSDLVSSSSTLQASSTAWADSAKSLLTQPIKAATGGSTSVAAYPNLQDDELEQAQLRKLRHIIRKAGIRKGMRVLEIGSGWGSFAMEAVRSTECTVDTITLSSQQKILAEARIAEAGLTSSITVHLVDFRNLPEAWAHSFDRLVSIEMLEAVGKEYIEPYFKMIDEVLNEHGVACFQVITIPESRFESYSKEDDFIRKYIFPGGFLPSVTFTTDCIRKGAQGRLVIDSIVNIGPHYARTLREWRIRFLKNFDRDIVPALNDEHPEMSLEDIQVFKRKWIYYFVYCEIGFAERIIGDHIITLTREGNTSYGCNVFE